MFRRGRSFSSLNQPSFRISPSLVTHYALSSSGQTFRTALGDERDAGGAAGRGIQRTRVPGVRQRYARPVDSHCCCANSWSGSACRSRLPWRRAQMEERRERDVSDEEEGCQFWRIAGSRVRFKTRDPETESATRFIVFVNGRLIRDRLIQHALIGVLPQHSAARRCFRWCCCFWSCRRRKWTLMFIRRKRKYVSGSRRRDA